jgi:hypothetical protein
MSIKKIEIKEKEELEPLLVANPEYLETGMKVVAHQVTTPTGPLDILAVDDDGALVIIELKNEVDEEEAQLLQGLRYYDWCFENRAWLANAYRNKGIDAQKEPRLILVAPDFSDSLKRLAKYLTLEIEIFRYQAIEMPDGQRDIVCNQVLYEERPELPKISTISQSTERIKDEDVRSLYSKCLGDLEQMGFELQPRAGETVSVFYQGKRRLRLYPKGQFFAIRILQSDGDWTGRNRIKTQIEWDNLVKSHLNQMLAST